MEFTKEQLIAYFRLRIMQADRMGVRGWHGDAGNDARRDLLAYQIALASLEAEPVAYTDADELRFPHATSDILPVPLGHGKDLPLYTVPPAH